MKDRLAFHTSRKTPNYCTSQLSRFRSKKMWPLLPDLDLKDFNAWLLLEAKIYFVADSSVDAL